jgi:tetratricopeptide (TPR) repeat protein
MKTKSFFLFLSFLTLPALAFAQARTGSTGTLGSPSSTSNNPAASSDIGKPPDWDSLASHAGDYLLGKVTVAGGPLPWDAIPVTVTCSGKTSYTAATDPKGRFIIAPANPAGGANSTPANNPGNVDPKNKFAASFVGCSVEAALPGFNSTTLNVVNRNIVDNPDIGTITLKPEEGSAGSAVSSTTTAAPKDAVKAFEKARSEWIDKKPDKAQKDLQKAVQLDPQFAEAWYQLGKIQEAAKSSDAANSYSKAVAADPKFSLPYDRLAPLDAQAGKWQETADATSHALQLNPRGTPQIWYLDALANYKLGKKDEAETSATKALSMDPLHTQPNTEQLLAVILVDKQDYPGALEHLRSALAYVPPGPNADLIKKQIAQLEQAAPASK